MKKDKFKGSMWHNEFPNPDKKEHNTKPNKTCKHVKRERESCMLNNNCKYPNCEIMKNNDKPKPKRPKSSFLPPPRPKK